MIKIAFESMGGLVRVKIIDKEVTCKGSFDNFQREYPLHQLISFAIAKDKERLQVDLDKHYEIMEDLRNEEEVYDYIVSEFQKQGFRIIREARKDV